MVLEASNKMDPLTAVSFFRSLQQQQRTLNNEITAKKILVFSVTKYTMFHTCIPSFQMLGPVLSIFRSISAAV